MLPDPGSRQQCTAVVPGLSGRAVDWTLSVNLTSALSQHPVHELRRQGGHCFGHWRDGGREEVEAGAGRRGAAAGEFPGEPGQEGGHGRGKEEGPRGVTAVSRSPSLTPASASASLPAAASEGGDTLEPCTSWLDIDIVFVL